MTTMNWSKGFLITFWVLQILVCIVGLFFGAIALGVKSSFDDYDVGGADKALELSGGLWISFSSVSFILVVTEIVMLARHDLRPVFAVASCAIKTTLWLVVFIIALSNLASSYNGVAIVLYAVFLVVFAIPLIYTSIKLRRHRRTIYTPVVTQSV